jgi:hypothetical protein
MSAQHTAALQQILAVLRGEQKNPETGKNLSKNERLTVAEQVAAEALGE